MQEVLKDAVAEFEKKTKLKCNVNVNEKNFLDDEW